MSGRAVMGVVMLVGFHVLVRAQPFVREVYGIPVTAGSATVEHPFSGGFYNPAHQFVDFDSDGDLDLFIYDYNDNSVQFYRNQGTRQSALFRFEQPQFNLPALNGWFRLADINGDGKLDILTGGDNNSVKIYTNTGTVASPVFTLLTNNLLDSLGNSVYAQVQCIPGFADIDGDGDLDFFTLNPGVGTINYYQNVGSPANILLAFRTDRWQNIQICPGCGGMSSHSPSLNPNHGQGTLYFGDVDGNRTLDMIYGDLFDPGLCFFQNDGTSINPIMDSITCRFPVNDPVLTAGFNQPTIVDIDGDGDLDLFVGILPPLTQVNNFWFYRNIGDSAHFNLSFVTKNFMSTLDFGIQSTPTFVDVDNDGDRDMFVGDLYGHIAFLENTGSSTNPSFNLIDSSYIGTTPFVGLTPRFADIDNDGDQDMFVGHFNGNIMFYRNTGSASSPVFQREISQFDSVNVGSQSYSVPAFFDFDNDGDLDLFVGKQDGKIAYFQNVGSPQSPRFSLVTSSFQAIDVGDNSFPQFVDVDGDGDQDLVIGADDGNLYCYRNDGPVGNPAFIFVSNGFGSIDEIRTSCPALVDIDGDGDADVFVGNARGGIDFYRNGLSTSVREVVGEQIPSSIRLYQNFPNPFNPATMIRFSIAGSDVAQDVKLTVFDVLGKHITTLEDGKLNPGTYEVRFDATGLAGGVYFYQLRVGTYRETQHLVLLK
jgi:large repetitive protein